MFFAAINLGFKTPYKSQVNEAFWLHACFNYIQAMHEVKFTPEQIDIPNHPKEISTEKEIKVPLNFVPDSTENNKADSLLLTSDSTKNLSDTLKVDSLAIDSTARLKYFNPVRNDVPYVKMRMGRENSFYAYPSPNYKKRVVEIDSTGKFVLIKEEVAGQQSKILLKVPIDEYIKAKLAERERNNWENLGYDYQLNNQEKGLSDVIKNITDFTIPLPKVGVLSIFGAPKISLKIGGAVDIHGAWRNETTQGVTASRYGNTRNEPDFKQQVQINVSGTIGDKLNISADWNTERTFQYENQLKIKYTGYEDEIVQSVEAGNVSLQTSPLIGGSEALFGVKAQFQLGPLTLTTLASQKKGEVKEVSVSGGSTSQDFSIRAYQYSTNHYFLDTVYASTNPQYNFFYKYYGKATPEIDPNYTVTDIEVWKSVNQVTTDNSNIREANAFIDLPGLNKNQRYDTTQYITNVVPEPGKIEQGRFRLMTAGVDYTLHQETGFITFNTSIQDNDVIAVAYRVQKPGDPNGDLYYGQFLNRADSLNESKLILKLIKPSNLQPDYKEAWKLLLKNIYPLGGRNIKSDGFEFHIKYEVEGQDPVEEVPSNSGNIRLLNAFGLDELNASGTSVQNGDGEFDFRPGYTILPETGEIIFPNLEPFGNNLPQGLDSTFKFQSVYDTTTTYAAQDKIHDKWVMTGKYSGESSTTYQLGFNIVENSVRVLLNGRELTAGTDYSVDYNIGQLTIINDAALVPGADLKITYEQNDLFQLASKTLLGARGILNISKKTKLGFSALNLNQQTLSDKVRIGEEPLSNSIYGVDFQTQADLPFLTKALDKVISTREMSSLSLSGEYAYINPDPNTKKSTIASDNGESIAYIDDFEGAKRTIPIGVNYTGWKDLSPPDYIPTLPDSIRLGNFKNKMDYKGKSWWFTITPSDVNVKDIYGDRKKVATNDQQETVMDFVFDPDTPGTYNHYSKILQNPRENWGGTMRLLSSTANNLIEQNIEYVEFWLKIDSTTPPDADVYLDLGRISEDVIPNGRINTEDRDGNFVVSPEEDTGLDSLFDQGEQQRYGSSKPDPNNDDFAFNSPGSHNLFDYFSINGTEGNRDLTDIGRLPDTEDLNNNGNMDNLNSYFTYRIPLDTNKSTNPFIAAVGGGNDKAWHLFRIPLKDTVGEVGSPSLTNITTIRLWATNASKLVHLRFAEFNLVGNQWQKADPRDTVMEVSVIGLEDDPEYYSPPGVFRERDRSQPDQQVYRNEQSMNLIVKNLPQGQHREAVKYLFRPLDVFNYKQMKLFIHGDNKVESHSVSYTDGTNYNCEVYFRFGADSNNYYEYRQPVVADWNEITIDFSELTAIKTDRGDLVDSVFRKPVPGRPGNFYAIKGNPSLTSVKFLTVGILNKDGTFDPGPVSGDVWVNELRVIGADNSPGWAYSGSSSLKLADLMNINFNMSQNNPYFHKLSDRFGSRVEQKNWSLQTDLDVLKLLPFNMPESSLKVNYSHSESIGKPLYLPGTDIKVDKAATQLGTNPNDTTINQLYKSPEQLISSTQSLNVSNSVSASNIRLKIPTSFWLIRDSFNSLTYGFNYNKNFSRSPTVLSSKTWVWNASVNYGLNFSPNYYFEPAKIPIIGDFLSIFTDYKDLKVYYTPQNLTMTASAKRNRSTNVSRAQKTPSGISPSQTVISGDFTAQRSLNFNWKMTDGGLINLSTNYLVNVNSSLLYLEKDANGNQRPESQIWSDILNGHVFGKPNNFRQSLDFKTAPRLPSLWDINRYFTITAGYSVAYQWNYDFRQDTLGRSAGYSSHSNVGLTLRLKSLTAPLFKEEEQPKAEQNNQEINRTHRIQRGRSGNIENEFKNENKGENKNEEVISDTTVTQDSTTIENKNKKSALTRFAGLLKNTARVLFFDYESIVFNYDNTTNVSKSGVLGKGTGFSNFWGLKYDYNNGPSRGFMVGLSNNVGRRAPFANLTDAFSQQNNFDFSTSRPLWEGAKLDIKWNVAWSITKSTSFQTDADGNVFIANAPNSTGTISRSFLSLPPVFFLSAFKSGIKRVNDLYDPNSSDPNQSLSSAFISGFESLPIFSKFSFLKEFSKYIPRPNWRLTWSGLEKFPLFKSFAKSVTLDHAYSSTYTEGWKITPDGLRQVQTQKVQYAFNPLVGLNFTFNELWGGNFLGSIKYSTSTAYDLGISTKNITETFSRDIGVTASYSKSGFEIPLFGVSLKNDIQFSLSYTSSKNSSIRYDMTAFTDQGTPQDGTTRTTIEPSIKYTISSKVTLSIFYKRSTVEPAGASRIPPTTTNEAGLDVHISIQ